MSSVETKVNWFKVLPGWTSHDYELSNLYGDTREQELLEAIVSEYAPLIKKGDPSVWRELDKIVLDILGIDTNVETLLIAAKQKIVRLSNSENDLQKRRNIFCEKANKFILETFDYIEPTAIKMCDFVPPLTINLSSNKYNPSLLVEDVCRGKTAKNDMQTEPGCSFNGDTVETVINEKNPLKNLKFLEGINPELRENISPSKIIIKPTSKTSVSKPGTSKGDVWEELNLETQYSGDNAGPSSESCDKLEACENEVSIYQNNTDIGINSSSNSQIPFAGSHTVKWSDTTTMLGKPYDPWSFKHYCKGRSDQNIQDLAVEYVKECNLLDTLRVEEMKRRHDEEMKVATEQYKKQKKLVNDFIHFLRMTKKQAEDLN